MCINHMYVYHFAGRHSTPFKSTVDDIAWSDSRRDDCVHLPHVLILKQAGIHVHVVYPSFITTVDDIEWSGSRRVMTVCICNDIILQAGIK